MIDACGKQTVNALYTGDSVYERPAANVFLTANLLHCHRIDIAFNGHLISSTTSKKEWAVIIFCFREHLWFLKYRTSILFCDRMLVTEYRDNLSESSGDLLAAMLHSKRVATVKLQRRDHFPATDLKVRNLCASRMGRMLMRTKGDQKIRTIYNIIHAAIRLSKKLEN